MSHCCTSITLISIPWLWLMQVYNYVVYLSVQLHTFCKINKWDAVKKGSSFRTHRCYLAFSQVHYNAFMEGWPWQKKIYSPSCRTKVPSENNWAHMYTIHTPLSVYRPFICYCTHAQWHLCCINAVLTTNAAKALDKLGSLLALVCDYLQRGSKFLIVVGKPLQQWHALNKLMFLPRLKDRIRNTTWWVIWVKALTYSCCLSCCSYLLVCEVRLVFLLLWR